MGSQGKLAVSNTGPLIHLAEINLLTALKPWTVLIPLAVYNEAKQHLPGDITKFLEVKRLEPSAKDAAYILAAQYQLGLGEAQAMALAKQEGISLFLTDDLDARLIAKKLGLDPHGCIGILLRAFREKNLSKEKTLSALDELYSKSSLFVTRKLIEEAKQELTKFAAPQ